MLFGVGTPRCLAVGFLCGKLSMCCSIRLCKMSVLSCSACGAYCTKRAMLSMTTVRVSLVFGVSLD